jgi:hypothetical protein
MDDFTVKVLLVILGFLFGMSSQIIVKINMKKRENLATRDLMRTEIQAFIGACENAAKKKFWDSSAVEIISTHIIKSYSNDRDRFLAASQSSAREAVYNFYLEVSALLSLIEMHRKATEFNQDHSSSAIGPGTYEGIVDRSRAVLEALK